MINSSLSVKLLGVCVENDLVRAGIVDTNLNKKGLY